MVSGSIVCANGNTYRVNKSIDVSDIINEQCPEPTDVDKRQKILQDMFNKDKNKMLALEKKLCKQQISSGNAGSIGSNADEIAAAKSKLTSFFNSAKSDASVWKTAEGKFNTARLASDLTAGVVLGTVGGVVSGVVIKKKQVEKGFDALHCAVGGQTIAAWGDTFTVGLK